MEFIDKYAQIDGSGADDAMSAGGDEANYSDVEFIDDETNVQDQGPSDYLCYQRLTGSFARPVYVSRSW